MKKVRSALLIAVSTLVCAPAPAGNAVEHPILLVQAKPADMAEAEVCKVEKNAGKVTLEHGEIKSLEAPS